jgi:hypothetical protein
MYIKPITNTNTNTNTNINNYNIPINTITYDIPINKFEGYNFINKIVENKKQTKITKLEEENIIKFVGNNISVPVLKDMQDMFDNGIITDVDVRNSKLLNSTALMIQARYGFIDAMKWLLTLDLPVDINIQNDSGDTALMLAVADNNLEKVTLLLEFGANKDIKNKEGETPLQFALRKKKLSQIIDILQLNPESIKQQRLAKEQAKKELENIDKFVGRLIPDLNKTKLVIEIPDINNMKRMISDNSITDINVKNKNLTEKTALMVQSQNGSIDAMKWLLDLRADPNIKDQTRQTALMLAVLANNLDKVNLLLEYGADRDIINTNNKTALQIAENIEYKIALEIDNNRNNRNLLDEQTQNEQIISSLKIFYPDNEFTTNLDYMKRYRDKLAKEKLDENIDKFVGGFETPNLNDMQRMINDKSITDINVINKKFGDKTALMVQTQNGSIDAMKWILELYDNANANPNLRADLDLRDIYGNTALILAVIANNLDKVQLLLKYGAKKYIKNNRDQTAFQIAQIKKNNDIISILLSSKNENKRKYLKYKIKYLELKNKLN